MANQEMLATALAIGKALQGGGAPLTINGITYDGAHAVEMTIGSPEIVGEVSEMIDPTRPYVLASTGTVFVSRAQEGYINRLPEATTTPGGEEIFGDGKGYVYPLRISSSTGVQKDGGSTYLTGYIPVTPGARIRLKGFYDAGEGGYGCFIFMYEEGGVYNYDVSNQQNTFLSRDLYWVQLDEEGKDWEVTLTNPNVRYIRVQTEGLDEGSIITVNQEIGETEGGGCVWVDTGIKGFGDNVDALRLLEARANGLENQAASARQRLTALENTAASKLPDYWEAYLPARCRAIRAHQDEGGKEAFSFAVMSDLHVSSNSVGRIGEVAKRVMDTCGLSFALDLGDFATRTAVATKEEMEASMEAAQAILAPLGDRLLRTRGNHDGFWGVPGEGGASRYYEMGYQDEEIWNRVFRPLAATGKAVFDSDGVGYYVDDTAHKARFVVLNTSREGSAMGKYRFGQSQFDLMAEALGTLPDEDWCVMFFSHVPPVTVIDYEEDGVADGNASGEVPEQGLLRSLVTAFQDRMPLFSGSYGASGQADRVVLENLDFSGAKGKFAGYFAGHLHGDMIFGPDDTYPFPVITVRCDAPVEEARLHSDPRQAGTYTEHSFDVVTVVRTSGGFKLYLDKIGAGEDRALTVAG